MHEKQSINTDALAIFRLKPPSKEEIGSVQTKWQVSCPLSTKRAEVGSSISSKNTKLNLSYGGHRNEEDSGWRWFSGVTPSCRPKQKT